MIRRALLGSFAFAALLIAWGPGAAPAQEAAFVAGTEDVPLMPGLADLADRLVVFAALAGEWVFVGVGAALAAWMATFVRQAARRRG